VILVGAPSEAAYVAELEAALNPEARPSILNTAGKLSLGELFAVIKGASCVITNDTGPMHIAFAMDRPTVCLFGPSNPEHYCVERDNVEVHYHPVFCSPCAHETDEPPCAGDNVCMQLIQPSAVIASSLRLLGEHGESPRRLPIVQVVYTDPHGKALGISTVDETRH
jgi:ADP-heptose:LPS heptosyltransferase